MELLAPARDLDTLKAAFDAGADAVYLGLKSFSARKRAKNFTFDEFIIANEIKKRLNKKVYVALNTLIFQDEIPELIETLAFLEAAKVDAIIIQDYGIYELIKTMDINIPLHASTQMGTKNHLQANFLKTLGFKRVVLERQLTLTEIEAIKKHANIELEVFVHGAMCFALSGLCFFSKGFTDRSGNRGDCAQPCRWTYYNNDRHISQPFSMKDMDGLSVVPTLMKLGITSIKIEGRMKGIDYVYPVVYAYRTLIDRAKRGHVDKKEILEIKGDIENSTLSRKSSTGFFFLDTSECNRENKYSNLIGDTGTGQFAGKIKKITKTSIFFNTDLTLNVGDTLRIDNPKGDERYKIPIKAIYLNNEKVKTAPAKSYIGIPSMEQKIKPGFDIFLVHRRYSYKPKKIVNAESKEVHYLEQAKTFQKIYKELLKASSTYESSVSTHNFNPEETYYCINNNKLLFIPPNVYENSIPFYDNIEDKKMDGVIISHPSESHLSDTVPAYTSFFLPATNFFAIKFFKRFNIKSLSLSPDLSDRQFGLIKAFFPFWLKWQNTPLCISRVPIKEGHYRLSSLKNRKVIVKAVKDSIYLF